MNRFVLVTCALFAFFGTALGSAAYYLSDMLLYRGNRTKAQWQQATEPVCSTWLTTVAYSNLSQSASSETPLDFPCAEAEVLPGEVLHVNNTEGLALRYKVFSNPTEPQAEGSQGQGGQVNLTQGGAPALKGPPLWLHVHGINGNLLHGARYFKAASRLGFQLVAMELSNHGMSGNNRRGAAYGCRENGDVVAVFEDLLKRFPDRDVLITASSMGTMALANAAEKLVAPAHGGRLVAVSLESPIPTVRQIVLESPQSPKLPLPLVNIALFIAQTRAGVDFEACAPLNNLKFLQVPTIVQHAEPDDLVPVHLARMEFEALPKNLPNVFKVYPKGGHSAVWNGNQQEFESDLQAIWAAGLKYRAEIFLGQNK